MKQLLIIAGFGLFLFLLNTGKETHDLSHVAEPHDKVIMYSLTTCGFCKQKARELDQNSIEFIEYFIDTDMARMKELNAKLKQSGFEPRRYGTPIMDVHGVMLPNNPSMEKILAAMGQ